MSSEIQLFYTPLSILSIPPQHHQLFFHAIVKLVTNAWEDEYRQLKSTSASASDLSKHEHFSIPLDHEPTTSTIGTPFSAASGSGSGVSSTISSRRSSNSSSHDLAFTKSHQKRLSVRSIDDNSNTNINLTQEDLLDISVSHKIDALKQFINVSFTPVDCSVICPTELVDLLFGTTLELSAKITEPSAPTVLKDQYLAIQVDDVGLDSGSSLLDISAPLAAAGIPIFFIPTYFSDYVLVPLLAHAKVSEVLESRGFVFSSNVNSYINTLEDLHQKLLEDQPEPLSPQLLASIDSKGENKPFDALIIDKIRPVMDPTPKLLLTGARTHGNSSTSNYSSSSSQALLHLRIIHLLLNPSNYFSVTFTGTSEVSFILSQDLVSTFPSELLIGSVTDFLIPILIDLRDLPETSTGIIAGVVSKLLSKRPTAATPMMQVIYLSTAKTGVVMVSQEDLAMTKAALGME